MLLLALISCFCGETEYLGAGDKAASGKEQCGADRGSHGEVLDGLRIKLWLDADVGALLSPWELQLELDRSELREGAVLTPGAGSLSGRSCYATDDTCEVEAPLTDGRLEVGDTQLSDDPCDLGADWSVDLSWQLDFEDPAGHSARSTGSNAVSMSIAPLCVEG